MLPLSKVDNVITIDKVAPIRQICNALSACVLPDIKCKTGVGVAFIDNPAEPISDGDIDIALNDIDTLAALFTCSDCGKYVEAQHAVSGQNKITCKCGNTELGWKQ